MGTALHIFVCWSDCSQMSQKRQILRKIHLRSKLFMKSWKKTLLYFSYYNSCLTISWIHIAYLKLGDRDFSQIYKISECIFQIFFNIVSSSMFPFQFTLFCLAVNCQTVLWGFFPTHSLIRWLSTNFRLEHWNGPSAKAPGKGIGQLSVRNKGRRTANFS